MNKKEFFDWYCDDFNLGISCDICGEYKTKVLMLFARFCGTSGYVCEKCFLGEEDNGNKQ